MLDSYQEQYESTDSWIKEQLLQYELSSQFVPNELEQLNERIQANLEQHKREQQAYDDMNSALSVAQQECDTLRVQLEEDKQEIDTVLDTLEHCLMSDNVLYLDAYRPTNVVSITEHPDYCWNDW